MKHYKTPLGVRALELDGSQDFLIQADWTLMTDQEFSDFQKPSVDAQIAIEQTWVASEMSVADIEINKHLDGDARAIATETKWRAYRCQLRDYIKDGQIVGGRPKRPV